MKFYYNLLIFKFNISLYSKDRFFTMRNKTKNKRSIQKRQKYYKNFKLNKLK